MLFPINDQNILLRSDVRLTDVIDCFLHEGFEISRGDHRWIVHGRAKTFGCFTSVIHVYFNKDEQLVSLAVHFLKADFEDVETVLGQYYGSAQTRSVESSSREFTEDGVASMWHAVVDRFGPEHILHIGFEGND